jgi:putative oxidoreductase
MSDRARLQAAAYAVLRIVSGALFALHGSQKLFGVPVPAPMKIELASQIGLGALIELVGGILIMLGLFTRPAALIASGTMAVAYFQFHWKLQTAHWMFLPMVNQGEPAVMYCFVFLMFAAMGGGAYSMDARRGHA